VAIATGTLQEPIVLDGAGSAKKKPEKTAISWVDAEWISLDDHLKQTYGLTGPRNAAPGFACRQNIREVTYPGFFHGCGRKDKCTMRHANENTMRGAAYMANATDAQIASCKACTPSFTSRIANKEILPPKNIKK
jgi:hypothetical protein